ncbi:hypothetical protein [Thermocatellispora tengchongensis]|uniref:hypothetical protein n=1 Tax=Thermocatellispora tengchongensis TaxID=1073253 RepID=UPI0036431FE3
MPPSEAPHAMVLRGLPNRFANSSTVDNWSRSACSSAQPVSAYDDPIRAYPWSSAAVRTAALGAF